MQDRGIERSTPLHLWSVDRLLVSVAADLSDDRRDALRDTLRDDPTVEAVLDVLTAHGLSATPSFLCVAPHDEGVRVVVRGDVAATAVGADGTSVPLAAGRAATWNDDVVVDVALVLVPTADGSTVEWLAPTKVTGRQPAPPVPEHQAQPEPGPEAEPTPAPEPPAAAADADADASATLDEVHFHEAVGDAPAPADDPLDFSSLLDDTGDVGRRPTISSVPGPGTGTPPAPPRHEPQPQPQPQTAPADEPTDEPAGRPAPTAPDTTGLGDHDGRTVTLADLRRLQAERGAAPPPPETTAPATSAPRLGEVRARRCPDGHPNPPTAERCRVCAAPIGSSDVELVPRPSIVRLVFDSGQVVEVDRPQLIGRRPTAPDDPGPEEEIPNLVTVPSPEADISRVHTAVRVEGWDVLVVDLGSTNGTEVRLPGQDPIRLREHDPVLVVPGTEVTMAGTVHFRIDAVYR